MKGKLAVLGFLCAAVTVGGVYATWTFAENQTPAASTTVKVSMTGVTGTTEKGTLSVTVMHTGGYTLSIDDSDNNHLPEIKEEGTVIVTFTPSAVAPEDVKQNGITVEYTLTASLSDWKYEGTDIFTGFGVAHELVTTADNCVKQTDGSFVWTLDADDIHIALTEAMANTLIDTKAKYDALAAELEKGHFVITVNEKASN